MSINKNKTEDFLMAVNIIVENTLSDQTIKGKMAAFGFNEPKVLAIKALYLEVFDLELIRKKEYGEKVAATTEFNNLWAEVDKEYMKALKVARIVLKDIYKADQAGMLYGIRKESFNGWQEQAVSFYESILRDPQLLEVMAKYGYPEDKLRQEYDRVKQVIEKSLVQKKETGDAQQATRLRDKRLDELAVLYAEMRGIAKVALDDTPDYLEKLGILARSEGSAPRKPKPPGDDGAGK